MKPEFRQSLIRLLSFVLVAAIGLTIFHYRHHLRDFAQYGYFGVFLLPLLANATVFVPIPGVMVIFTMGAVLNPLLVAVLGGLGAATGELTGYLVGFSGQGLAEHVKYYDRIRDWMEHHRRMSDLLILVAAIIPNPFFDAAGIAAGSLKVPMWRFLVFCALGSIIKMMLFSLVGNSSLNWLFPPPPHHGPPFPYPYPHP